MSNFKNTLLEVLKIDSRVWIDKELDVIKVKDLADKYDEKFIEILLNNEETRKHFFMQIKDVYVFKQNEFKFFLDENKLDNSYTSFANQIGLYNNSKLLRNTGEVVLNWPFKDCVLEGGQSSEEGTDTFFEFDEKSGDFEEKTSKRKEIFFNEILARDEIDRLEEKKALKNFKRFTKDGEQKLESFKRDAEINKKRGLPEDTITDNLIIKGNNLLALHSINKEFAGKVKLIYIDPPYNTGNDGFKYNDNFNHSSWLTFMKNRLEITKELLKDDGVIFVQCDDNEQAYLKVLMDEVFYGGFLNTISVEMSSASGVKSAHRDKRFIKNIEFLLIYRVNNSKNIEINPIYDEILEYDGNYTIFFDGNELTSLKDKLGEINKLYKDINQNIYFNIPEIKDFITKNKNNIFRRHGHSKWVLGEIKDSNLIFKKYDELKSRSRVYKIHNPKNIDEYEIIINTLNNGKIGYERLEPLSWKLDGDILTVLRGNLWKGYYKLMGNITKEGIGGFPGGQKPEKLLFDIINSITNPGDIVLDYHLGSGTTGAVAHKMGRQYIGIEQMDYIETISVERLKKVIEGEQGGISKTVNFTGGGEFVYFELAKWNEEAKEKINECNSLEELEKFFEEMYEKYFLNYNLKIKEFKEKLLLDEKFKNLSLDKQKYIFLKMLDLNQMYVNFDERNDKKYNLSESDIKLSEDFYNINN